jgi:hypothetical protein
LSQKAIFRVKFEYKDLNFGVELEVRRIVALMEDWAVWEQCNIPPSPESVAKNCAADG